VYRCVAVWSKRKVLAIIVVIATLSTITTIYAYSRGYTDKIYIEFSDEFKVFGKGFVNIIVMSPDRWKTYKFSTDDVVGKRVEIDVRDVVQDFVKYYKNLTTGYRGPLLVPSISVTMFYFNGSQECIASYVYTTRDFFMEQGLNEVEAGRRAWQNPMALFETVMFQKPVIRFRLKMPAGSLKPVCTDFTPALREFIDEWNKRLGVENTASNIEILNITVSLPERGRDSVASILPTVKAQTIGACKLYGSRVFNNILYMYRNNPPPGWYNNITGISDGVKYVIWNWYASNFSKEYLWEQTPSCTSDGAVFSTAYLICLSIKPSDNILPSLCYTHYMWVLTTPGIYDMDAWLNDVKNALGIQNTVNWRDYKDQLGVRSITTWTWVPYLGIRVYNPYEKRINVFGSITLLGYRKVQRGISFMGIITWPQSEEQITGKSTSIACMFGNPCERYAVYWTGIRYVGDVMAVMYDVSEETINGKKYWVVTPVATVFPGVQTSIDYNSGTPTGFIDKNLLYSFTYGASFNHTLISRSNVPRNTLVYRDSPPASGISADLGDKLMQLGGNIFLSTVFFAIQTLIRPETLLGEFLTNLIGSFFSFAWEDLYQFAIFYDFNIMTEDYIPSVTISLYKYTLQYRAKPYRDIGYVPLLVIYEVYIY
jgi:hypothetical protein